MLASRYENLFSPVTINSLELKNRAVMPAMGTGYGAADGTVTDRLVAYLAARAAGGAGLMITEVCAVDPRGKGFPTEIGAWSDALIESLARIPEAIHREGSRVALQLHHAGRETFELFAGAQPEAPSPIPSAILGQPCEEMSEERIAEITRAYASAASRAKAAGFDAVEVHGAHGYLICQFLSPFSNARTDGYGGSDENRARFALEVLEAVRDSVGPRFPVIFRVSASEEVRGGYDLAFMEWLAPRLVAAGADAVHASVGIYSTPGNLTIAAMDTEPGFNLGRARAVKRVVDVPVIAVGRINDPALADRALASGAADLVSFGRQHLADPEFLSKASRGDDGDIRRCLACNQGCIDRLMFEMKPVTCSINPECGEEYLGHPAPATEPRTVWVVGAGPAGLSAALAASGRGHSVRLFESAPQPGGQLQAASRPPDKEPLAGWVDWAVRTLEGRGVEVRCGTTVDGEMLASGGPDTVIVATGAVPSVPEIPGIGGPNVFDAREVLLGKVETGPEAVILGAGYVGMETADYLVSRGVSVTVLEALERAPVGTHTAHGYWLYRRLNKSGGRLLTGARVVSVEPDSVVYVHEGEERVIDPAPFVVTALGATSERGLADAAAALGIPCQVVGDAVEPRRLLEAVHEGHAAGLAL